MHDWQSVSHATSQAAIYANISRKLVVLRYIVAGFGWFWLVLWVVLAGFGGGFGWFWLVLCFSNYGHNLCVSCICDGEYKLKNMLS